MKRYSFAGVSVLVFAVVLSMQFALADYQKAITLYRDGKYAQAIQELKPDIDNNKEWEPGPRILGLCYLGLKDYAMAEYWFSRAAQLKSSAFQTYFGLGQAYYYQKKYDSCIAAFNKAEPLATAKEPDKLKASLNEMRGQAYFQTKRYNEAIDDLIKTTHVNQSDWANYYMLGFSYFSQHRIDDAIPALEKALSMKAGDGGITDILGKAYLKKGTEALSSKQYAEAAQALMKAKGYNPKDGYIYYNLAEAYKFQKRFPEAEKELLQAVAIIPQSAEVHRDLGYVYEMQKKWDPALNSYKKAEEISPIQWVKDAIKRVTENKKK
jgi:tetratricopeptide (TPR) repeat protein